MIHTLLMSTPSPIEIKCFPYQHVAPYKEKNEISILTYNIKQLLHWTIAIMFLILLAILYRKATIFATRSIFGCFKEMIIKTMSQTYPFIIKESIKAAFKGLEKIVV